MSERKILFCFQSGNITNGAPYSLYLYLKYSKLNLKKCTALFPFKGDKAEEFFEKLEILGINIKVINKRLDFRPIESYLQNPFLLIRRIILNLIYLYKLYFFISKEKFDIIYINGTRGNSESLIGKLLKKKVVWHVRNLEELARPSFFIKRVPRFKFILKKIRLYLHNWSSDIIITVARSEKRVIESLLKKRKPIYVIPNGIEEENIIPWGMRNNNYTDHKKLKILCLMSTICPQKGSNIVIKVAEKLKEKKIDFIINIYGKERKNIKNEKDFSQRSYLLQKDGFLKIYPFTNNVKEVMLENDILLFPSYFEGFPRTILEAMASQIFIIASAIDGILDQISHMDSGILCQVEDVNAIIDGILFYLNYPELREKIVKNAWIRVKEKFLIKDIALKIDNILNQV